MPSIKVKATAEGYYAPRRFHPGDVFEVKSEDEIGSWMQRLDKAEGSADKPKADEKPKSDDKPKQESNKPTAKGR